MEALRNGLSRLQFRMWDWAVASAVCVAAVWWIAPHQLSVVVYKVTLVAIAANLTYWVDHSLFKRARDRIEGADERDLYSSLCVIRRAMIFLGCVLGLSLGV